MTRLRFSRWLPGLYGVFRGNIGFCTVWKKGRWWHNNHHHIDRRYRTMKEAARALL